MLNSVFTNKRARRSQLKWSLEATSQHLPLHPSQCRESWRYYSCCTIPIWLISVRYCKTPLMSILSWSIWRAVNCSMCWPREADCLKTRPDTYSVSWSLRLTGAIITSLVTAIWSLKTSCWTRKRRILKLQILEWQLCSSPMHYYEPVAGNFRYKHTKKCIKQLDRSPHYASPEIVRVSSYTNTNIPLEYWHISFYRGSVTTVQQLMSGPAGLFYTLWWLVIYPLMMSTWEGYWRKLKREGTAHCLTTFHLMQETWSNVCWLLIQPKEWLWAYIYVHVHTYSLLTRSCIHRWLTS